MEQENKCGRACFPPCFKAISRTWSKKLSGASTPTADQHVEGYYLYAPGDLKMWKQNPGFIDVGRLWGISSKWVSFTLGKTPPPPARICSKFDLKGSKRVERYAKSAKTIETLVWLPGFLAHPRCLVLACSRICEAPACSAFSHSSRFSKSQIRIPS